EQYEVVLKAGDMERVMEKMVWHVEDLRVGQCYPNFYTSRLASKFVKVCLSGTGGDELFAGYPWRYYNSFDNDDFDNYAEKYYRYWQRLIPDRFKSGFFQPEIYPEVLNHLSEDVFRRTLQMKTGSRELSPEEYVNRSLYFEAKTFLHGLLVVEDKLSMANTLETRVPFLDNELVDFAMRVPVKYKLNNLTGRKLLDENLPVFKRMEYLKQTQDGKILLRRMVKRYVPEDYSNGAKQGFSAPDASWFKGESIDYIRGLLFDKKAAIYDYLQPALTQQLMNEHFTGQKNRRLLIWSLLNFEWWLKIFKG
ncbi:MAG: asparagine synthase, partial [bacterium]|nr:asparagine synthase [bacterium]